MNALESIKGAIAPKRNRIKEIGRLLDEQTATGPKVIGVERNTLKMERAGLINELAALEADAPA